MDGVKSRRELYAEETRRTLVETGRERFLEHGYLAVSAEDLVRGTGLSRGALYHHFEGKEGLFQEVFEEQEERAAQRIAAAMTGKDDPWEQALAGVDAFLDVCAERDYRELVLLQGPIALGWHRWRELDQRHLGGLLVAGIQSLIDAGVLQDHPAELLAAALYGGLTEISLRIADAGDPATARRDAGVLARSLLEGVSRRGGTP
ncbi:TetR/AcrR family transcriptional regulator [Actinomadura barringtoniae]|uniref:TetR/AcrR family transcriptional regulator n=1 Tax=Actinomadura barringtoniae TaxID=1427535 RepID=A0A939PK28_9ACTN|nr:TetR/AcrR family transcriptional regulator [Actinomadura barringtoniae]MBO2454080.1 TetR/AcrR family transcriptional regulator [Actinomadura barringtoniae]